MKITAIIPAAGSGSRYSSNKNKILENINDVPVIIHTLKAISEIDRVDEIIICTSSDLMGDIKDLIVKYNIKKVSQIISGGATRQESVFNGLKVANNPDYILIHDAARPLISKDTIDNAINVAVEKGASIVAVPTKDTIKRVNCNNKILETLNRSELWNVQTPQIFKYKEIIEAHIEFKGQDFTDDSILLEKLGIPVFVVNGNYKNIKITTQEDIKIAEVFKNNQA